MTEATPLDRVYNAVMEALEEGARVSAIREKVEEAFVEVPATFTVGFDYIWL